MPARPVGGRGGEAGPVPPLPDPVALRGVLPPAGGRAHVALQSLISARVPGRVSTPGLLASFRPTRDTDACSESLLVTPEAARPTSPRTPRRRRRSASCRPPRSPPGWVVWVRGGVTEQSTHLAWAGGWAQGLLGSCSGRGEIAGGLSPAGCRPRASSSPVRLWRRAVPRLSRRTAAVSMPSGVSRDRGWVGAPPRPVVSVEARARPVGR